WTITVLNANQFRLNGSAGNAALTSGGTRARGPLKIHTGARPPALGGVQREFPPPLSPAHRLHRGFSRRRRHGRTPVPVTPGTANGVSGDFSVGRGNGDTTFQMSTDWPTGTGTQPSAVVTGDLNGDGLPDIVTANKGTDSVTVFLAVPGGGYAKPTTVSTVIAGKGHGPVSLILADLTGTKKLDIVVVDQTDSVLTILSNDGAGAFPPAGTVSVGAHPTQVVAADFDGNGKLDLAVAHNTRDTTSGVTVLLGNGDRTFQIPREVANGVWASALA